MALRRLMKTAFVLFAAACAVIAARGFSSAPETPAVDAAELSRHATPSDCWIAVDGAVYDVTAYLPEHPAPPGLIEPWCGRDASVPWADKGVGRSHSPEALSLLETRRVSARRRR